MRERTREPGRECAAELAAAEHLARTPSRAEVRYGEVARAVGIQEGEVRQRDPHELGLERKRRDGLRDRIGGERASEMDERAQPNLERGSAPVDWQRECSAQAVLCRRDQHTTPTQHMWRERETLVVESARE